MKVFVTGASGFLGQLLVDKLVVGGHDVFILDHSTRTTHPGGPKHVTGDITKKDQIEKVALELGDIDCLIHLAALVPKNNDQDLAASMEKVNVTGTLNLLEVFGPHLKDFIYASTAEVYGLPETAKPIKESSLPQPLSYYGATKLSGELISQVYSNKNHLPVTILRFSVMYGPGDTIARAIPNFINRALDGKNLEVFGGQELRDYIHVEDAAQAIYLASQKPRSGTFNIGTGKGISIKDTAAEIIKRVNPSLTIDLLARRKKASDIVLDTTKAEIELGFKARYQFPAKLEEQIEWHKNN